MQEQRQRLVGVDLLRFLAAASVMMFHLAYRSWITPDGTPYSILQGAVTYPELTPYSWWGSVGVEVFFVISGVVIANSASHATAARFAWGRFLRLAPALWLCATLTIPVALLAGWSPENGLVDAFLRTIVLWPSGGWLANVYWTLGVEISYYLLVFCLLIAGRFRWIEATMAALLTVNVIMWVVFALSKMGLPISPLRGRVADLLLLNHGSYFALGVFIWRGHALGWSRRRITASLIAAITGLVPLLAVAKANLPALGLQAGVLPAVWLASVAAILVTMRFDRQIAAALGARAVRLVGWLGLGTYPLYLFHDVAGPIAIKAFLWLGAERFTALAGTMVLMVAVALVIAVWAEPALSGLLKRVYPPRRERSPATAQASRGQSA